MTPQEKASEFVKRFPLLFDNPIDHEHWIEHLTELIESGNEPKHTPEQQKYLDKCAIAAMQKFIEVHGNYFERIVNDSHDFAEKMLAERERRRKA